MGKQKGQSSIEFFIYFSITLTIFAFLYIDVVDRQISTFEYREALLAENIGEKYGYELENALMAGEGYEREFALPREIFGSEYDLTARNGTVEVDWNRNSIVVLSSYSGEELEVGSQEGPFIVENRDGGVNVESR